MAFKDVGLLQTLRKKKEQKQKNPTWVEEWLLSNSF